MHIVLVCEGFPAIHIPEATLIDGCTPSVGGIAAETHDIEPARWFKTLVIDYITIDCGKRLVKWNMDDTQPSLEESLSNHLKRNSRILFSEGEFYDYEAKCDELFDTIADLFDRRGETTLTEMSPVLLKMLHCHILPNINMDRDDTPKLQDALEKQQLLITKVEERVEELSKVVTLHESCLLKNRTKFIDNLNNNGADILNFDLDILEILKCHVVKDIQKYGQKLEELEDRVVRAKQEIEKNPADEQLKWDMKQKRIARDSFFEEKYVKLLNVREVISEQLLKVKRVMSLPANSPRHKRRSHMIGQRKSKSVSKQDGGQKLQLLHNLYVETTQMQLAAKEQIKNLVTKKVLMVSVKEAIAMTIRDLEQDSETVGMDSERGYSSCFSTDVLSRTTIPSDWLTFEDKITDMINDPHHQAGIIHKVFCDRLAAICNSVYEEEAYYRALDKTPLDDQGDLVLPAGTTRWFCKSKGMTDVEEYLFVCDMDASPSRKATDRLKVTIRKHFEQICPVLRHHLQTTSINKTWVTYESNFYEAVNKFLVPLYESAYSDCTDTLRTQSDRLTVDDLEISEPWVLDMLVKRRDSGIESDSSVQDCAQTKVKTVVTYNDEMMSDFEKLHNLYAPGDIDGADSGMSAEDYGNEGGDDEVNGVIGETDARGTEISRYVKSHPLTNSLELSGGEIVMLNEKDAKINIELQKLKISRDEMSKKRRSGGSNDTPPSGEYSSYNDLDSKSCDQFSYNSSLSSFQSSQKSDSTIQDSTELNFQPQNFNQDSPEYSVQSLYFKAVFAKAHDCLISIQEEDTPLKKMQIMTRCLKAITTALANPNTTGPMSAPCSDELVTVLVVLLLNLAPDQISRLYVDFKFVCDLMAPCLESGVHSFSVVQLEVAFQYIFTKLMKIKNQKH